MQVATLYNICKALQSFHARGMVHCSLGPSSFSWFQGGQGWKVAACGDWAQAGMHVRSCYHLRYASPEVCPHECDSKSLTQALFLCHKFCWRGPLQLFVCSFSCMVTILLMLVSMCVAATTTLDVLSQQVRLSMSVYILS